ncbi:DODA-type extradiol aromatic ring-opening family dioxygenase [Paludibacterium purpuratum]|uniref:4,5-DOPA dioxygenase extradiol n=1 Tax=Paludibacterium purpuratum TaxID=1144873 RepID=A0A4R7BEX0_9NEIS|nr:class III extradiol ring-cleavage dioxygenase [Paludibacterium purpuratum]TDR82227.1 4,5-DOPA dioxygenase extradiol [Paludibacterium purpuratum]
MKGLSQPALFVSHGAPTLALEDSPTARFLEQLGRSLPRPTAVVVVSAHWESARPTLGTHPAPDTIHDFGGFPRVLYTLRYPAHGTDLLFGRVREALRAGDIEPVDDATRGLDHGAWTPLMRMFPDADVPVINLSLPRNLDEAGLRALGRALRPLRAENILILASGSYTHNLWQMQPDGSAPPAWAEAFAAWVDSQLLARQDETLDAWMNLAPHARQAHPSDEHFLPLFIALGAASDGVAPTRLHDDWRYGGLSMALWRFD